jgi:hypothetical protein
MQLRATLMHLHDRYALALAMLDGDRDARKVLADLLEEQGERGLAQWAREGRNQKHRRLVFAVHLMPCRVAIGFATHLLKNTFLKDQSLAAARLTAAVEQWCQGRLDDRQVQATCAKELAQWRVERRNPWVRVDSADAMIANSGADRLVEAISAAIDAEKHMAENEYQSAARRENESRQWVRQILIMTRSRSFPPVMEPDGSTRSLSSIDWQIEHTKVVFQELLSQQASPWPK